MNYQAAKTHILERLRRELSEKLFYHGLHHTLDVLRVVEELASKEAISEEDLALLRTAALFHDAGFVQNRHAGHESIGCEMARSVLPVYGYSDAQLDRICGMIMATRIPQSPQNRLEQMLCDADLDYLGRADFYPIAESLFDELKAFNLVGDEQAWNQIQVKFLDAHHFWTASKVAEREPEKRKRLDELRDVVSGYQ